MDWLLSTPQIQSAFSSLGCMEGDTYVVSPNAFAVLEEINYKLTYEDQTLRTFRRSIGFGQNVRSDLIPVLENAKDDAVLDSVIRILVNLTVPVECLFSVDVMHRTEVGRHTIYELNTLLYQSKEAFTEPKSTKSVVEYMKHILESDCKLSPERCDKINNCLLLLRNILHIPEHIEGVNCLGAEITLMSASRLQSSCVLSTVSMQNAILWNLFIQSIDKLLLYLMTCPQRPCWGVTMVQLIALMYKDQHVSTLQKLLNMWFEASISESSEDNESNTSPPKQGSGDSSPMLTSDPTSDSSDNGGGGCKNECTEERRQALREETDATLQEVSRIGHEYQNAILRVQPLGKNCDVQPTVGKMRNFIRPEEYEHSDHKFAVGSAVDSVGNAISVIKNLPLKIEERMETLNDKDDLFNGQIVNRTSDSDEVINCAASGPVAPIIIPPALPNLDDENFKTPPTATLIKAVVKSLVYDTTGVESQSKELRLQSKSICQKVPHGGQLNLTKGKCCPQKRECPSSQSELSDCGYGTQVENQESISTSSNDDDCVRNKPQHQKPPCNTKQRNKHRPILTLVDKKELRRKKLVKRSKSSLINMKGLVQHLPTDEDISKILKEFTVDFLLKGYGNLVQDLHAQLLTDIKIPIDTSHFFWLVTYFLKFAAQLELDMEHINFILTYEVISYLTYEGAMLCEQLELNSYQEGSDLKPYLRRIHLVVTAIREFLQAIEIYKKISHLSENDQIRLRRLQIQISCSEDLRCLFVLLLRRFNPQLHTIQYLQDLVVTNHILLLILDSVSEKEDVIKINMIEHISQFATLEIMHYYGILLEDFLNNGEFVNDCIFTMMHHVGGDLGQIGTLFQPVILKTYSRIWEADYELCDDWSDLIEFVIHKFMNTPPQSPLTLPSTSLTELTKEHNIDNTVCTWAQEEMDTLYWYYVQSKKANDIVGAIVDLFCNNGNKQKTRISIIQQLLQQDIITLVEYDDLMKFEDAEYQRALLATPTSGTESGIDVKNSPNSNNQPSDDIQTLLNLIIKDNKEKQLKGLQKLLLECCHTKLLLKSRLSPLDTKTSNIVMEPLAYHCILKNKSIPVVQWNNEQAATMLFQPFVLLLHKLGFQLPADAGSVFARIPDFWTAETMYTLARKLGPLDEMLIKFDTSELKVDMNSPVLRCGNQYKSGYHLNPIGAQHCFSSSPSTEAENFIPESSKEEYRLTSSLASEYACASFAMSKVKHYNSIIRFTPDPLTIASAPNWLQLVIRSKCSLIPPIEEEFSTVTTPEIDETITINSETIQSCPKIAVTTSNVTTTITTSNATVPGGHSIGRAIFTRAQDHPIKPPLLIRTVVEDSIVHQTFTGKDGIDGTENDINNNECINIRVSNSSALESVSAAEQHHQRQPTTSVIHDDATVKKIFERNDSGYSSQYTRSLCGFGMDSEQSTLVTPGNENDIANSENASVASDLTRMYVSDEDERNEVRIDHYH